MGRSEVVVADDEFSSMQNSQRLPIEVAVVLGSAIDLSCLPIPVPPATFPLIDHTWKSASNLRIIMGIPDASDLVQLVL